MALRALLLLAVLPVTAAPRCAPQCPPGSYPHPPDRARPRCGSPRGRPEPVRCRVLRCPAPLSFPHGTVQPRFPAYPPGSVLRFECDDGFVLRGTAELRCRRGGVWSDPPPVCDDGDPFSYDLPEDISGGLGSSFASILELAGARADDETSLGRRIVLSHNGSLHVYLLLDASGSVQQDNFELFRQSAVAIVDRLSSFEVPLRFAIVSFATNTRVIISTTEEDASDADEVIARLEAMNFGEHGNATGTNMHGALLEVYHMVLFQKERSTRDGRPDAWKDTRHVVILLTDGRFNVGGHPRDAVAKIEDVLEIKEDREEYLDIYAFGVGALEVDMAELEAVASHRRDERHAFKLADALALHQALEGALAATALGDLCGVIVPAAGGQEVSIRGWNIHEDFDIRGRAAWGVPEFYDYDVALVELEEEVGDTGLPRGGRNAEGGLLRAPAPPGHHPRDFAISLFRIQPWLRRHLGGVLRFTPL
ncbi:hypothetical protein ASZ78_011064 [Callipepla squamata]|uniref:Complement C2 n=1 Tax=Callipepla squamata TaxID=9009 RepID=A0A226MY81_CALSU|nr:hypothetical protein ASZ78_011064 [Callipepla squamata]